MCGRYAIELADQEYIRLMRELAGNTPVYTPRYNIAPQQLAPVIRTVEGETRFEELRWGFRPAWLKEKNKAQINARAETVFTSRMFKHSAENRRCLVPATAWYEWQKAADRKQPYAFHLKQGGVLYFAGIWTRFHNEDDTHEDNYAIITTEANPLCAPIHNRMPVILEGKDRQAWMDPENKDVAKLLQPYGGKGLEAYPVSTYVNAPKNTDARCLEPIQ